jgi:hypothetical protein
MNTLRMTDVFFRDVNLTAWELSEKKGSKPALLRLSAHVTYESGGRRGQEPLAGTARRVLRTKGP